MRLRRMHVEGARRHVEASAAQGLRTLLVAGRRISGPEYTAWLPVWTAACAEVGVRRELACADAAALLESRLALLGSTAVEDRLQAGVPETIAAMQTAGIRVWMITGDKASTGVQVARAARLVRGGAGGGDDTSVLFRVLGGGSAGDVARQLAHAAARLRRLGGGASVGAPRASSRSPLPTARWPSPQWKQQ